MPSANDNDNNELTALRFIGNKTRTLQGWLVEGEDINMLRELAELETTAKDALAYAEQKGGATSALLTALVNLVRNQEEGWRATGTMPEEHIQAFPYLREARAAIKQAKEAGISTTAESAAITGVENYFTVRDANAAPLPTPPKPSPCPLRHA
jgi:hypothetical protein